MISDMILWAVKSLRTKGSSMFSRKQIREEIENRWPNYDKKWWDNSGSPIFQFMRKECPHLNIAVSDKYRNVFERVSYGVHQLTEYGERLIQNY